MEFYAMFFFIVFICLASLGSSEFPVSNSNFTDQSNLTVTCVQEHVYDTLDIREVLGKWYALEVYMHLSNEGVNWYKTCPIITMWVSREFPRTTFGPSTEHQLYHVQHINAKFRQEYRHLRLLWDEAGQTIEYTLYFRNDSVGYWQVFDGQNGTVPRRSTYQEFSGSVQVLKAVNDHLVLNFCQEAANGKPAQLFSVLFSREPGRLPHWEINSIHNLLQNKKLSVASRRMVCGNSAARSVYSIVLSVILVMLTHVYN